MAETVEVRAAGSGGSPNSVTGIPEVSVKKGGTPITSPRPSTQHATFGVWSDPQSKNWKNPLHEDTTPQLTKNDTRLEDLEMLRSDLHKTMKSVEDE